VQPQFDFKEFPTQ